MRCHTTGGLDNFRNGALLAGNFLVQTWSFGGNLAGVAGIYFTWHLGGRIGIGHILIMGAVCCADDMLTPINDPETTIAAMIVFFIQLSFLALIK